MKGETDFTNLGLTAYPEICQMACANPCGTDWEENPDAVDVYADPKMATDVGLRKPYARHFGGVNLGFLDGHASWWNSENLIMKFAEEAKGGEAKPLGLTHWGPATFTSPPAVDNCGDPTVPGFF